MSSGYTTSDEEFDLQEEEDLLMILVLHASNKKPKHGGSVFGRQKLWRERVDAHERLMRNYFVENSINPESSHFVCQTLRRWNCASVRCGILENSHCSRYG